MSPILFTIAGYVFRFHSREEERIHVHVMKAECEAKIWIEPEIEIAENYGFSSKELSSIKLMVQEHGKEIRDEWENYFC